MDYFHADRRPVWRRSPGPDAFLRRAIPVHGLRPADLPGKPARHRDLPLGPRIETLSHGLPPAGPALDAGRCQRKARLAYPCGVGPAAHHPGEDAVRRRRTGVGPDQYRLRPGLDDHRSVPVGLSVGALPHHQGGGEDAHAARPAGQHSEFYPHLGWQAARRSCPRYALAGSRSHLRRGSWLRRLCPPLSDIPHMPSKFVEIVPLSHRQGNCIPYAAIRWHDFGNRPALGRPLGHFSRHPDTPLLSLSPRRRFPRPTPERVFVADHQSSSGFSGTGPSAPPPQPIGT